ncbi:MAG: DUF2752 domain-containing protein [Acidimicrobiia bacterium]
METTAEGSRFLRVVRYGAPIVAAGTAIGGCVLAGVLDPERHQVFPQCPVYAATGWYCPGCGMTRALHHLVHGNIVTAARYNLLLLAAIPVIAYCLFVWFSDTYGRGRLPLIRWSNRTWYSIATVVIVWVVARNTPLLNWFALGRA